MKISFTDKDNYNHTYISCFYNHKRDYVFLSKKVCCSSFSSLDKNKCIKTWEVNDTNILNGLVRNPYTRLESLYKDKLIKNVDDLKTKWCKHCGVKPTIQHCQTHIVDFFGEEKFYNQEISFKEFILALPTFIDKECHFFPQSKFIPKFIDKLYYLENKEDLNNLFKLFDVEPVVVNKTYEKSFEWDNQMYDVVNTFYYEDFQRFGYKLN